MDKTETIKVWIAQRLEGSYRVYRWQGYSTLNMRANYTHDRVISKDFGKQLAHAFSAELDASDCVDLCNDSRFRRIRNRTGLDEVLANRFPRDSFYSCSDCGEVMLDGDDRLHFAYDENPVCASCIDDNYIYSEYDDTFMPI